MRLPFQLVQTEETVIAQAQEHISGPLEPQPRPSPYHEVFLAVLKHGRCVVIYGAAPIAVALTELCVTVCALAGALV